jgi:syntaxin-binding protein 1
MAQECMNIFEKQKLTSSAHVEQVRYREVDSILLDFRTSLKCCATGLTPEGKTPKNIIEEMVPLLDSKDVR